jgi:UDP-GlcNAc:undecaprenyl-phosphate GlcNAc-1-phosphate transferase
MGFYDIPSGYKAHARATPYLGGLTVLAGVLASVPLLGADLWRIGAILVGLVGLWLMGTLDDRFALSAPPRVAAEALAALLLYAAGLGWSVFGSPTADLALTVLWVVGLVNAYNLMDNMDGATSSVGAASALGIAALALALGDLALAVLALALCGACFGFLRYNLARPARIFLGDGGSMSIGFLLAALAMSLPLGVELGAQHVLASVLVAGLATLDTTLVVVSRRRAGVSFLQGGQDHLTHRLRSRLGTPRRVAATLALAQASAGATALVVIELDAGAVVVAWGLALAAAAFAIVLLESPAWAPLRRPAGQTSSTVQLVPIEAS